MGSNKVKGGIGKFRTTDGVDPLNLSHIENFISTCVTMRKIKKIIVHQPNNIWHPRPQSHVLIISPFGTFKSSILSNLRDMNPKDFGIIDDFTKPAVQGSLSKNGEYIPTVLIRFAGKTMGIDEWNSIDEWGQKALLSLLENQEITRALGFKINTPWSKNTKYAKINVVGNVINAKIQFSCIACAMVYPPVSGKLQKQKHYYPDSSRYL